MPAKEKALSTTTHFLWYTPFIFNGRQYVHLSLTFIGIQYSSFGPQDQGGWLNATVADWFEEYARWLFQSSIFSADIKADTLQQEISPPLLLKRVNFSFVQSLFRGIWRLCEVLDHPEWAKGNKLTGGLFTIDEMFNGDKLAGPGKAGRHNDNDDNEGKHYDGGDD